jgi:hypothetical protein
MEVCSVQLGIVGLLLLLVAQDVAAIAVPDTQCHSQCGGVDIHFPFGIGDNCSRSSLFNVSCKEVQDGIYKPFLSDVFELLNISLIHGTIRELNPISTYCYNPLLGRMESNISGHDAISSTFRFSDVHNKFTVIGCNTLAIIYNRNSTGYQSGCVSTCQSLSDIVDGSCSGMGCCQTAIPKGMDYYSVSFDRSFNTSQIWSFSRCSYAVLMEAAAFNFSTAYINTTKFNDMSIGQVPVVMDWAIRERETSCEVAEENETGSYACVSSNSECVDSSNGPGYLCNCTDGYEGNPYLLDGCHGNNCAKILRYICTIFSL